MQFNYASGFAFIFSKTVEQSLKGNAKISTKVHFKAFFFLQSSFILLLLFLNQEEQTPSLRKRRDADGHHIVKGLLLMAYRALG